MLNVTSRIAVRIDKLPDWEVDWNDNKPQLSVDSLTVADFLPSEDDATHLKQRAVRYMKNVLVSEFSSLSDLKPFVSEDDHRGQSRLEPSKVAPMKVLLKDEKYTSETIEILSQLAKDTNFGDCPQVR